MLLSRPKVQNLTLKKNNVKLGIQTLYVYKKKKLKHKYF